MLPFTLHERTLDRGIVDALRALQVELEQERALRVADRARIQRLEDRLSEPEDAGKRPRPRGLGGCRAKSVSSGTPRACARSHSSSPNTAIARAHNRHIRPQVSVLGQHRGDDQAVTAA